MDFELIHEIPAFLRIEDRARPPDRRHPLSHLSGKLGRAFRAVKLKPKQPPGHGPALADLDQQFDEALRPESLQVPGVESFLRRHVAAGRQCGLDGRDLDPSFQIAQ